MRSASRRSDPENRAAIRFAAGQVQAVHVDLAELRVPQLQPGEVLALQVGVVQRLAAQREPGQGVSGRIEPGEIGGEGDHQPEVLLLALPLVGDLQQEHGARSRCWWPARSPGSGGCSGPSSRSRGPGAGSTPRPGRVRVRRQRHEPDHRQRRHEPPSSRPHSTRRPPSPSGAASPDSPDPCAGRPASRPSPPPIRGCRRRSGPGCGRARPARRGLGGQAGELGACASRVRIAPVAGSNTYTLRLSSQNSDSRPSRIRLVESIDTIAWVRSWSESSSRESSLSCAATSAGAS